MLGLAKGLAHISFQGGSVFMPARSPYDRELLVAEVVRESHMHDTVQILLGDDRWLVHKLRPGTLVRCSGCGRLTDASCRAGSHGKVPFCVTCAVGERSHARQLEHTHSAGPAPSSPLVERNQ